MAAWSQLPDDVWCAIAERLQLALDRVRFRSVCKTWRSLVPFPQPPWLMLSEDEHNPNTRGFVGLGQEEKEEEGQSGGAAVHQIHLPEVYHSRAVGSTGTWLVTVDLQFRIRLLNPFSRLQFDLPPLTTLDLPDPKHLEPVYSSPEYIRNRHLRKVVLSSGGGDGDCIAMAIYNVAHQAYARPGDTSWTLIALSPARIRGVQDLIFYKGQFHGINTWGILIAYNLRDDPVTATQLCGDLKAISTNENVKYLVECAGDLLLVVKFQEYIYHPITDERQHIQVNRFQVYKFNFTKRKWIRLKDLGEYCLFLGLNTSVAVSVSSCRGFKKNSIYFTDDFIYIEPPIPRIRFMGVFDLEDNSFRAHYEETSTSSYSPPIWIVPKSCCRQ